MLKKVAIGVIGVCVLIIACTAIIAGGDNGESDAQKNAQKLEEKRKGFHCLSAWDGNHDGFERLVKARLKDPDSMETRQTHISPVNPKGEHKIVMSYGARNSFGGMTTGTASGWVNQDTCQARLLSLE